ncbi:MAG: preprotein translocase subunit SecE [Pseudomonadota bacterium]
MADKIKLIVSLLILAGGVVGFYVFADQATWIRVLGVIVALVLAIIVAAQSEPGRAALSFVKESRTEVRKVVWPTRKETVQTTMIVMVVVVIVGILLWLLDMFLLWAVQLLTGQGS